MANIDTFLQGNNEDQLAAGNYVPQVASGVVDLSDLATAGFANGDVARVLELPKGALILGTTAAITEALVNVTNTDFGNTIADAADPDDYVNAQTDSAVGLFTAYASGGAGVTLTADCYLAFSFVTSGVPTGKVAWTISYLKPASTARELASHKTYTYV